MKILSKFNSICEVGNKHAGIQLLRGACAIQVFLSHALNIFHIDWVEQLNQTPFHFFIDGNCAVIIFFVLSGYLYYKDKVFSLHEYINGIKKKCFRILPTFWLSLVLGFMFCNLYFIWGITGQNLTKWSEAFWVSNVSVIELVKNAVVLMPHNWDTINPASWYIQVEVEMFILMPIIVSFYNRLKNKKWSLCLVFFFGIGGLLLIPNMLAYLIGALFHKFKFLFNLAKKHYLLLLIASVIFLNIKNEIPVLTECPGSIVLLTQSIGAAGIISIIIGMGSNRFRKFKLLIFLGNISYELYIFHFIFLLILRPFFQNVLLYTLTTFLISVFCSSVAHLCFKRLYIK